MAKYEGPTAGTEVKYRGRTWVLSHRVEGMPGELLGNWWAECVEDGQMGIISGLWALKQWLKQQREAPDELGKIAVQLAAVEDYNADTVGASEPDEPIAPDPLEGWEPEDGL